MKFVYVSSEFVKDKKKQVQDDPVFRDSLRNYAENLLKHDFSSITNITFAELSDNPHDYCSQAPYWWPDPQNPDGPYIRRDGEYNLERFTAHLDLLRKTSEEVSVLAQAGYYLTDDTFSDNAAKRLKVFFIDESTKMNPNLNHAQAIKGICDGRKIGIIDAVCVHKIIHSLDFLRLSKKYNNVVSEMEKWFASFLYWLQNSQFGKEEKLVGNNHSMWYAALVMAISSMLNKLDTVNEYANFYRDTLVYQIQPNGAFADEITRTNSLFYSVFNLNGTATVCEIAFQCGIDLWSYETNDSRGIRAAILFLLPFLRNRKSWPYPQISKKAPEVSFAIALSDCRLNINAAEIYDKLQMNKTDFYDCVPIGPLSLVVL